MLAFQFVAGGFPDGAVPDFLANIPMQTIDVINGLPVIT
jgi:hypothetical protein